ncbi:hypothetical protein WJX73_002699 [Symbiochloris irregularis]|uniref:F-box domain-containing protein n=1 Tax=Symbiochloris irregularis TaxID=706552 RepID=A0AAW1PDV9_9CHLO
MANPLPSSLPAAKGGKHALAPLLYDVFRSVLPSLNLRQLAAVVCTCKELRQLAYEQDDLWRRAAADCLPHPLLAGLDGAVLRRLLARRALARSNIEAGRMGTYVDLATIHTDNMGVLGVQKILISPCSSRIAVVTTQRGDPQPGRIVRGCVNKVAVFDTDSGTLLWQKDLASFAEDYQILKGVRRAADRAAWLLEIPPVSVVQSFTSPSVTTCYGLADMTMALASLGRK